MGQRKSSTSKAPQTVKNAVHEFRKHHEKVDRSLKLVAESARHLEKACGGDGKALIAQLVAEVSPRWSAARLPKHGLIPAVEFAATATLVAVLAAFEELGVQLAKAGSITLPNGEKQTPGTTKAGVIANAILAASNPSSQDLAVLVNYFGRIRNAVAHADKTVTPDTAVATASATYSRRHRNGLPPLPTSAGHLTCEQAILASALCLKLGESLL